MQGEDNYSCEADNFLKFPNKECLRYQLTELLKLLKRLWIISHANKTDFIFKYLSYNKVKTRGVYRIPFVGSEYLEGGSQKRGKHFILA